MDTRNAIAMFCNCPGNSGHLPGCELHLWLLIKYGKPETGIRGIASIIATDDFHEHVSRWYEKLHDKWVCEKRMDLEISECGWLNEE